MAQRIDPEQARNDMGAGALLVCAYDDPEKFDQNHLEGAIPLADLERQASSLPKNRELIFYCA
jgi:rhodanese-related sulfurtransferase